VTDAILFIDDPYPSLAQAIPSNVNPPPNSPTPILCAPGSICSATGSGGTSTAYGQLTDPYLNQSNVFLGSLAAANSLQWPNVPLDPPGDSGIRLLRISNVRANAAQLGLSSSLIPNQVVMAVQITGASAPTVNFGTSQTVGFVIPGITAYGPPASLSACSAHNASLIGGSAVAAFDFTVAIREGFAQSLQRRNAAITLDGVTAPQVAAQNIPGLWYNTLTAYYFPTLFTTVPNVGLADFGSRIQVIFRNVSTGTHLFVPVSLTLSLDGGQQNLSLPLGAPPPLAPGLFSAQLRLVNADQFGTSQPGFTVVSATESVGGTPAGGSQLRREYGLRDLRGPKRRPGRDRNGADSSRRRVQWFRESSCVGFDDWQRQLGSGRWSVGNSINRGRKCSRLEVQSVRPVGAAVECILD
jgi:hypothetical protein